MKGCRMPLGCRVPRGVSQSRSVLLPLFWLLLCTLHARALQTRLVVSGHGPELRGELANPSVCPLDRDLVAFESIVERIHRLWIKQEGREKPLEVNPRIEKEEEPADLFTKPPEKLEASYDGDLAWCPVPLTDRGEVWFAFVSSGVAENQDIYLGNSNAREFIRLTKQIGIDDHPCWSPTGKSLVYVSTRRKIGGPEVPSDLYLIQDIPDIVSRYRERHPSVGDLPIVEDQAHDTLYFRLTDNPDIDDYPDWAPDGRYIVYSTREIDKSRGDRSSPMSLAVLDLDVLVEGCKVKRVPVMKLQSKNWEATPRWSPDGRFIAYYSYERSSLETDSRAWKNASLSIKQRIESDSGATIQDLPEVAQNVYIGSLSTRPSWGPDGKTLVYIADMDIQNPDVRKRGRFPISLVNTETKRSEMFWNSPDTSAYFVNFVPLAPGDEKAETVYITYMGEYNVVIAPVDGLRLESLALAQEPRDYTVSCERKGLFSWPYIVAAPGAVIVALAIWHPWTTSASAGTPAVPQLPAPPWPPSR
jgi:dipeptidyl aminopeptidase/acylaminoacyl peptidase